MGVWAKKAHTPPTPQTSIRLSTKSIEIKASLQNQGKCGKYIFISLGQTIIMSVEITTYQTKSENEFRSGQVLTITSAHFIHDVYSSFFAPLLPEIIRKLSLSLTQAGFLSAMMQIPSLLNPFIGYLDDKVNLRLFVIFSPAVTGVLMSSLGLTSSYYGLMILLFITGLSIAAFHAPAPAMIARVSGDQVGRGMSYFMAGGELARSIAPILATWAVAIWTFEGIYRLAVIGIATSVILYLRFRGVELHTRPSNNLREIIPQAKKIFPPLLVVSLTRSMLITGMSVYLPTLLNSEGASLMAAGGALAIYEMAGVGGALFSGIASDKIGRKPVLFAVLVLSSLLVLAFVSVKGWLMIPVLILLGFAALSAQPVMMALVQDHFPNHRSVANGFYLSTAFVFQSFAAIMIGYLGDRFGLRTTFLWIALISLFAVPLLHFFPEAPNQK
jgi:MFS transporter, FSR family, fosmidomycin resistance protein